MCRPVEEDSPSPLRQNTPKVDGSGAGKHSQDRCSAMPETKSSLLDFNMLKTTRKARPVKEERPSQIPVDGRNPLFDVILKEAEESHITFYNNGDQLGKGVSIVPEMFPGETTFAGLGRDRYSVIPPSHTTPRDHQGSPVTKGDVALKQQANERTAVLDFITQEAEEGRTQFCDDEDQIGRELTRTPGMFPEEPQFGRDLYSVVSPIKVNPWNQEALPVVRQAMADQEERLNPTKMPADRYHVLPPIPVAKPLLQSRTASPWDYIPTMRRVMAEMDLSINPRDRHVGLCMPDVTTAEALPFDIASSCLERPKRPSLGRLRVRSHEKMTLLPYMPTKTAVYDYYQRQPRPIETTVESSPRKYKKQAITKEPPYRYIGSNGGI